MWQLLLQLLQLLLLHPTTSTSWNAFVGGAQCAPNVNQESHRTAPLKASLRGPNPGTYLRPSGRDPPCPPSLFTRLHLICAGVQHTASYLEREGDPTVSSRQRCARSPPRPPPTFTAPPPSTAGSRRRYPVPLRVQGTPSIIPTFRAWSLLPAAHCHIDRRRGAQAPFFAAGVQHQP